LVKHTLIQKAIKSLTEGEGISSTVAASIMESIMTGELPDAQIAAYLATLHAHGEDPDVVAECSKIMQNHARPVQVENVIDICGTGGDGIDTFNVSTAASFVVAAAGARVAKHGNRAMSSNCGSADILEELGANLDLNGLQIKEIIEECGFAFLFAQKFHPAMKHVAKVRQELGIPTIFNLLGPLTNPAYPKGQLAGVGSKHIATLMAEALRLRKLERSIVVHSHDGLDEISISAPTTLWVIENDKIVEKEIKPQDFGMEYYPLSAVRGGTPKENAQTLKAILVGAEGPVTDFVILNAAAGCYVAGIVNTIEAGVRVAKNAITSGKAQKVASDFISLTQKKL
jgi:anthranilate phosphoribosyltransferase